MRFANRAPMETYTVDRDLILAQARALVAGERDAIANAANLAALVFASFPALNWAGFYFVRGRQLVLGPFQGKPACVRIAYGAGVCGGAWERNATLVVPDVHAFAGHIACDAASNAEIVVPLRAGGRVVGVLDVDSPVLNRFSDDDRRAFEALAALYAEASDLDAFARAPLGRDAEEPAETGTRSAVSNEQTSPTRARERT